MLIKNMSFVIFIYYIIQKDKNDIFLLKYTEKNRYSQVPLTLRKIVVVRGDKYGIVYSFVGNNEKKRHNNIRPDFKT